MNASLFRSVRCTIDLATAKRIDALAKKAKLTRPAVYQVIMKYGLEKAETELITDDFFETLAKILKA